LAEPFTIALSSGFFGSCGVGILTAKGLVAPPPTKSFSFTFEIGTLRCTAFGIGGGNLTKTYQKTCVFPLFHPILGEMKEGGKVVCINDEWPAGILRYYTDLPKKGQIYTIRTIEVGIGWDGTEGEVAVTLQEIVNPVSKTPPHRERGFKQERFADIEPPEKETEEVEEPLEVAV